MSAALQKARVFAGYRRLFRARKSLFVGDVQAMTESRKAIKVEFVKNKAAVGGDHIDGLIIMADEAVDMLTTGIVRGDLNSDSGHYEVKFKPEHVEGTDSPMVEPITAETVTKMEQNPHGVEVTKSSSPKKE